MQIDKALNSYLDAGFPIIYINSFEETKVDKLISSVVGGREGLEWNGSQGFCDFRTKQNRIPDTSLAETLSLLCTDNELDRKFLVIKDAHLYFDDPKVITCLKSIALKISQGLDAVVIIVSSVLKFPKELEKFITIIETDYPDQNEIKAQITAFANEQEVPVADALLEEMSLAFKDLTEFEIEQLLSQAYADGYSTVSAGLSKYFFAPIFRGFEQIWRVMPLQKKLSNCRKSVGKILQTITGDTSFFTGCDTGCNKRKEIIRKYTQIGYFTLDLDNAKESFIQEQGFDAHVTA